MRALIGKGFVGSNIGGHWDVRYDSNNIHTIKGRSFTEVLIAAPGAEKWRANRDPDTDWGTICYLEDCLSQITADHVTLISTVDVYGDPWGVSELDKPRFHGLHYYGKHRLSLEKFIEHNFHNYSIVRLPALFGPGLKKNALFDLIHNNQINRLSSDASYQWYPVSRLTSDLDFFTKLKIINVTPEPVFLAELMTFFGGLTIPSESHYPVPRYDVHSIYSPGGYFLPRSYIILEIGKFVETQRH